MWQLADWTKCERMEMQPTWKFVVLANSLALALASAPSLDAQPQPSNAAEKLKLERARVLEEMHALTDLIKVSKQATNEPVERIKLPIFRYNSPSRLYQDGSIWAWGKQGRPLVVMEMFTVNARKPTWVQGCVLTSTELVEASRLNDRIWYPRGVGVQFKPLPDASVPSDRENLRLRQMKRLARRFSAHQFWDPNNTRYDLRLLVQPVHRYNDPDKGLVDGSMYLMAHEIEPEVIIMIEGGEA